jgi:MutS domain I
MTIKTKVKPAPSPALINAVAEYLCQQVRERAIGQIVNAYQVAVLEELQLHVSNELIERGVPDQVILDPEYVYMVGDPNWDSYFVETKKRQAVAFPDFTANNPDACPHLVAENKLVALEIDIVEESESLTGVKVATGSVSMTNWRKMVDATIKAVLALDQESQKPLLPIASPLDHVRSLKELNRFALVFVKIGDFYEVFHADARVVATVYDTVLTSRQIGSQRVPCVGVPYHAFDRCRAMLAAAGYVVLAVEPTRKVS